MSYPDRRRDDRYLEKRPPDDYPERPPDERHGYPLRDDKPLWTWYLLPIFLSIIGGVMAYIALRDRDRVFAKRALILGVVLFLIPILIFVGIVVDQQILFYDAVRSNVQCLDHCTYGLGPIVNGTPTLIDCPTCTPCTQYCVRDSDYNRKPIP